MSQPLVQADIEVKDEGVTEISGLNHQLRNRKDMSYKFEELVDADDDSEFEDPQINKADHRPKYRSVSNEKRMKLIKMVIDNGKRIKSAAKRLGINYSTAKSICQVYKKEGRTEKKDQGKEIPVKKAPQVKRATSKPEAAGLEEEPHRETDSTIDSSQQAKNKAEKPCLNEIETRSMRKKVKMSSDDEETHAMPEMREELKSLNEYKHQVDIGFTPESIKIEQPTPLISMDHSKGLNHEAFPSRLMVSSIDSQKIDFLPSALPLPLPQEVSNQLRLQQQLQQYQRSLLATRRNQLLSQFYTQQTPQLAIQRLNHPSAISIQRFNQPPAAQSLTPLKSIVQTQELQILNKIAMSNIIYGHIGTNNNNIHHPQRSNFF